MPRRAISEKQIVRIKKKILLNIKTGCTQKAAAELGGISEATFYLWVKKDIQFMKSVSESVARSQIVLVRKLNRSKDWKSAAWMLERRFPKDFAKREYVEKKVEKNVILTDKIKKQIKDVLRKID